MNIHSLLTLLLFFLTELPYSYGCYDDERAALLNFKSSLTDPLGRLSSWQGQNCCDWHGIRCSLTTLHVTTINLRNPNSGTFMRNPNSELVHTSSISTAVNGTISPSLFTLSHLQYLDLSFNNFKYSSIPPHFANLTSLSYLNLSNSMFSGSITTQFANLSTLQYLDISCAILIFDISSLSYDLSSLKGSLNSSRSYFTTSSISSTDLSWLRALVNLRVLCLSGVDLYSASSTMSWAKPISVLSYLRVLDLSNCRISSAVPVDEFLNLTHLSYLQMDFNFFRSSLPVQLANITSLSFIIFRNSYLQGSTPYLPQVQALILGNNPDLVVDLASFFAHPWPNLEQLFISSTHVIGSIPSSISNVSSLKYIDASSCSIEGYLPSSVTNLSNLQHLNLNINKISGYIPTTISYLNSLQHLLLYQNHLEGPIPESICNISSLQIIHLASNKFSGKIPHCIGELPNLTALYIGENLMEGTVSLTTMFQKSYPIWLGLGLSGVTVEKFQYPWLPSFQLEILNLRSCKLNGSIPLFLCNSTQLVSLDLAANNLIGTIPSCLFNLPNLHILDLSHNNLNGVLPHTLPVSGTTHQPLHIMNALFIAMKIINLASNDLEGPLPLPPEDVVALDLSSNYFTGEIPIEFGEKISNARYVSLSGNELSGCVPISICSPDHILMSLNLSSNKLSGSMPSSLGNCVSLISLDLGANNFTGNVPDKLGEAKDLKALQLNDNNFSGAFPSFIRQLKDLEVLNLGNNDFKGKIPVFIGDLQKLQILVLRSNSFNESIPTGITHLKKLQFLDLSSNKISGHIPKDIGNLEMLRTRPNNRQLLAYLISLMYVGVQLQMVTKGTTQQLAWVFTYNSGIDLSCNFLVGNIPDEFGLLKGVYMLNLSHNRLSSDIPMALGEMIGLESLDLSFNHLNGRIPQTLTSIDFLGYLNLSCNNLSGRIPTGRHFETLSLDGSAYIGNAMLCGLPLKKSCEGESTATTDGVKDDKEDAGEKWLFYAVVALGYGVGFWGLFLILALRKEKWWVGYWRCVDKLALKLAECVSN